MSTPTDGLLDVTPTAEDLLLVVSHPAFQRLTRAHDGVSTLVMTAPVGDHWRYSGTLLGCIQAALEELPLCD